MTADHITQPYTLAELRDKIATHEYSAELLLQHAMLLLDRQASAEGASMMPSDADIEWPDIDDLAHSAAQEAYSYGISHDLFKRWMTSAMFKTASAIRAAIIAKQEAAQPDVQPKVTAVAHMVERPAGADVFVYGVKVPDFQIGTAHDGARAAFVAAVNAAAHSPAPAHAATLTINAPNGDKVVAHGTAMDMMTLDKIVKAAAQAPAVAHGWRPMRTAPKDGTAILVLIEASDVPYAVRWDCAHDHGWLMTWDNYRLSPADGPRYWMPCPADPDEAHPPVRKEDA